MTCGIYAIKNRENGKSYVGSSVDIEKRWTTHRWHLRRGSHHSQKLQRAWAKHGDASFYMVVLEVVVDPAQNLARERAWIAEVGSFAHGYNVCEVGANHLGVKRSEQTKERIRAALTGKKMAPEHRARMSRQRRGVPTNRLCAPETRAKIAAALSGRPHTDSRRANQSAAKIGKKRGPMSDQTKASISEAHKAARARSKTMPEGIWFS